MFQVQVLNLVKHYNFAIGCVSIWDCLIFFWKLNLKICEFKTNIWNTKQLQIKKLSTENM